MHLVVHLSIVFRMPRAACVAAVPFGRGRARLIIQIVAQPFARFFRHFRRVNPSMVFARNGDPILRFVVAPVMIDVVNMIALGNRAVAALINRSMQALMHRRIQVIPLLVRVGNIVQWAKAERSVCSLCKAQTCVV